MSYANFFPPFLRQKKRNKEAEWCYILSQFIDYQWGRKKSYVRNIIGWPAVNWHEKSLWIPAGDFIFIEKMCLVCWCEWHHQDDVELIIISSSSSFQDRRVVLTTHTQISRHDDCIISLSASLRKKKFPRDGVCVCVCVYIIKRAWWSGDGAIHHGQHDSRLRGGG